MKNLILFLFLLIALFNLQAQSVDVTLGGNSGSETFNIVNSDNDTIVEMQANGQSFFRDKRTTLEPTMVLLQETPIGNSTLTFNLLPSMSIFSAGIDNSDLNTFKICNTMQLQPTMYGDRITMFRIHSAHTGIIDFNNQSRAREYLITTPMTPALVCGNIWTPIPFNIIDFDEHGELDNTPPVHIFTALEEGYYQVNARCEYKIPDQSPQPSGSGYVSIAIYKNYIIHSQGNNLQLNVFVFQSGNPPLEFDVKMFDNNAPNVSDVVYLNKGETIDIRAFHNFTNPTGGNFFLELVPGPEKTYVSIHKVS